MSLEVYFEPREQTIKSAEGKTIYLNDSDNKQLVSVKLNGETSQVITENSPSPDYPSSILNLSGNLEFKIQNKNLFDKNNADVLNAYLSGGKVVTSSSSDKTIYIPCKPNTTYTVSKMVQETTANNRFALGYSNNIPTLGSSFTERVNLPNGTTETSLSITTDSNAKYLLAYIYYEDTETTFNEMLDSIQIEERISSNGIYRTSRTSNIFPITRRTKTLSRKLSCR